MALLKHGRIVDDPWRLLEDEAGAAGHAASHTLVPLALWRRARGRLLRHGAALGVLVRSDEDVAELAGDLEDLALVALEFPRFTDGRPYSSARLLRQRYGFKGELRAVGQVLRDQLAFMQRVGFDAYQIPDDADVAAWRAAFQEIGPSYQPAADRCRPVYALRQATRAAAPQPAPPAAPRPAEGDGCIAAHWAY